MTAVLPKKTYSGSSSLDFPTRHKIQPLGCLHKGMSVAPKSSVAHQEIGAPNLLRSVVGKTTVQHSRGKTIYSQGDKAATVYYNVKGTVLLTVVSANGKEGVVEIIAPGELFGETCVLDRECRTASAMTLEPTTLVCLDKLEIRNVLRNSAECAEEFMRHLIHRNQRIQNHLEDQLFNSSELRLARTLRLLARGREQDRDRAALPRISQSMLAAIVGTTRSRISYFLMNFRRMGIIDSQNGLHVNTKMIDALLQS